MGGLVAQLRYLPTLVGEVQLRVKGAHCLVGDLGRKEINILLVASGTQPAQLSSVSENLHSFKESVLCWRPPSDSAS